MGLIKHLPLYIGGVRIDHDEDQEVQSVLSLDAKSKVSAMAANASQIREALRFSVASQKRLDRTTLQERMDVVKLVLTEYAKFRKEIAWGLAEFRGLATQDSEWMCDLLIQWSQQVEELVSSVWGLGGEDAKRVLFKDQLMGLVGFRSRGQGALITSSTMDGPPGVAAICHAILSGTHMIIRPSWRDVVSHFMFQVLHEHKLDYYCQLVRWQSEGPEAMAFNRQLISNVKQGIVFCSDKTFDELMSGVSEKDATGNYRSKAHSGYQKINKYGTGLPLVIVSKEADLDASIENIFVGARRGNGKFCLSHTPVLVDRKIYPALLEKLVERSKRVKSGDLHDRTVERGLWEAEDIRSLKSVLPSFGGRVAYGEFYGNSMDVIILEDVPQNSPCLSQEFPGTLLALIPYDRNEDAIAIAQRSLLVNNREAWTAVNIFGSTEEYEAFCSAIDSFHFLRKGITSEPRFLLPHQGRYFAFDLTRRQTTA